MNNISIFGTNSDAGKSTVTFIIGKILQEFGLSVAPFKAQNFSNNAIVCDDGSEISIAQYFQADILGVKPSYQMNPVLLKSGANHSVSVIVEGQVVPVQNTREYYKNLDNLKPAVDRCFEYLDSKYDCLICEGAGSPVELNLMDKDLSNIYVATKYKTKIILVADIEKGGVFSSVWGVYNLLPQELQKNVIGVIINKFRGDMRLFDDGVSIIEKEFGIPVLGVLPYRPFYLGFEDSLGLRTIPQNYSNEKKKIAIISYPYMSNYNDFEPLLHDEDIYVEFIESNSYLDRFDTIILPGSKLVLKDLEWLKKSGLFDQLKNSKQEIIGICGGYEMMFEHIIDSSAVESEIATIENGLGLIKGDINFKTKKTLKSGRYTIFGNSFDGFEIHHGMSDRYPLSYEKDNIKGTFVHGIFNSPKFINKKHEIINEFVDQMKKNIDISKLKKIVEKN
jgi:adenosylcobyric acid synthase